MCILVLTPPLELQHSSVQFSPTPIPDKTEPVTRLVISSQEQVAGSSEQTVDYPAKAALYGNILEIFT